MYNEEDERDEVLVDFNIKYVYIQNLGRCII
jgi:hypothetical protein